jgi:hypothetical protein
MTTMHTLASTSIESEEQITLFSLYSIMETTDQTLIIPLKIKDTIIGNSETTGPGQSHPPTPFFEE